MVPREAHGRESGKVDEGLLAQHTGPHGALGARVFRFPGASGGGLRRAALALRVLSLRRVSRCALYRFELVLGLVALSRAVQSPSRQRGNAVRRCGRRSASSRPIAWDRLRCPWPGHTESRSQARQAAPGPLRHPQQVQSRWQVTYGECSARCHVRRPEEYETRDGAVAPPQNPVCLCHQRCAWQSTTRPPSRQTWRPTSRRRVLPDLEGGIKMLEVGTKSGPSCGVGCAGTIPFCMALLNQCCTQNFGFWQLRRISPTRGGGGGWGAPCPWAAGNDTFHMPTAHKTTAIRHRTPPIGRLRTPPKLRSKDPFMVRLAPS